jgi:cyanophycin synthetase
VERAETLGHIVGALLRYAGIYVSRTGYAHPAPQGGALMALPAPIPKATQQALNQVSGLVPSVARMRDDAENRRLLQDRLSELVQSLANMADPRINVFMLHQAADRMGIPVFRLLPELEIVGTGQHARWFNSTITDKTPSIGIGLAKDKQKTAALLGATGLPGGVNVLVADLDQARSAAEKLGFPVVVKPNDKDRGLGVFADLRTMEELEVAFSECTRHSSEILVEKWAPGFTHRLTVFENKVIRVVKRVAGGVTGDGRQTIRQLVDERLNTAEFKRRASLGGSPALSLDAEATALLARDGLDEHSVLPAGQYIRLRRKDNINAGGTNETCSLADVHPDNMRLAEDAARMLRLDFAGIDLIISDVTKSWMDIGALICEINAQPQLRAGGDVTVYEGIFKDIFRAGACIDADVLIVPDAMAGSEQLATRLSLAAPDIIVSTPSGLWREGRRITGAFRDSHQACIAALTRQDCHAAQAVLALSEVVTHGLPTFAWKNLRVAGFGASTPPEELAQLEEAKRIVERFFPRRPA